MELYFSIILRCTGGVQKTFFYVWKNKYFSIKKKLLHDINIQYM